MADLVHPAHAGEELGEPADLLLGQSRSAGDVAHARRAEARLAAEHRGDRVPELLVRRREADLVAGEADPGAVEGELPSRARPAAARGRRARAGAGRGRRAGAPGRCRRGRGCRRGSRRAWRGAPRASRSRGLARRWATRADADEAGEGVGGEAGSRAKASSVDLPGRAGEEGRERGARGRGSRGPRAGRAAPACGAARGRAQVEEAAAADRALGAGVADHEAVAGGGRDRAVEDELDEGLAAGRDRGRRGGRRAPSPRPSRGAGAPAATGRPGCLGGEHAQAASMRSVGACSSGVDDHVATVRSRPCDALAGEVERAAVAGTAALGRAVLRVEAADAHREAARG